jgi:hypothetical protein
LICISKEVEHLVVVAASFVVENSDERRDLHIICGSKPQIGKTTLGLIDPPTSEGMNGGKPH